MEKLNILITSVGRRSYLVDYFKSALKGLGHVHVSNSSEISPALQIADKYVISPLIYDNDYIPFIKKYCAQNNISAIISLFDADLPVLSKHKEELEKIVKKVIVSDYNVIEICNDKWKTYDFLIKNGFNTPKTYISIEKAKQDLGHGIINYPVIIKPRWGMGSIGVFEADNDQELMVLYNKTKRSIENSYLKYESNTDMRNSVLIQEKITGEEYGLDVINDLDGNYINTIVKKKFSMRAGETDCAITINDIKLKKLGESISNKLTHISNLDVDVFYINGEPYILEMNARFGGGYPFSHMAGVDLPKMIVKWLLNENTDISLLKEKYNEMYHKDIKLVKIQNRINSNKVKIDSESELLNLVHMFEKQLDPSLSERKIDLSAYAKKLFQFATVIALKTDEKEPIGIAAAYINDNETKIGYLSFIVIDKKYRGFKFAKMLIKEIENLAVENGMKSMKLEVRKDNEIAIRFYNSEGYSIINDASETSFFMSKSLVVY